MKKMIAILLVAIIWAETLHAQKKISSSFANLKQYIDVNKRFWDAQHGCWRWPMQGIRAGFDYLNCIPAKYGCSVALIAATRTKDVESVVRLLAQGANPDCRDKKGRTPLMIASRKGYKNLVSLLLSYDVNPRLVDTKGMDALMHAAQKGKISIAKILAKSCPPIEDETGRRASCHARDNGFGKLALSLMKAGKKIQTKREAQHEKKFKDFGDRYL